MVASSVRTIVSAGLALVAACSVDPGSGARPPLRHGGDPGKGDSSVGFWWIGATVDSSAAVVNSGIRTTFAVVNAPPPAGCVDSWASQTLDNGIWGQVGYAACNLDGTETFTGFYQVYSGNLELVDGEISMTEGLHSFAMTLASDTTWTFAMDGQPFGALDMGTASSDGTWSQIVTEEGNGVPAPYSPPAMDFPEALSLLSGGAWMQPAKAIVYNTMGVPGVIGSLQDPTLSQNQIALSPSAPLLDPNATLWDASAAPSTYAPVVASSGSPFVMLDSPAAGTTVAGTVALDATATSSAGLANVTFWIGGDTPACVLTSAPFTCDWDTTAVTDGETYVTIIATDASGQQTALYDTLIVRNH